MFCLGGAHCLSPCSPPSIETPTACSLNSGPEKEPQQCCQPDISLCFKPVPCCAQTHLHKEWKRNKSPMNIPHVYCQKPEKWRIIRHQNGHSNKYQIGHFWAIFVFFGALFFLYFRGPTWGGGLCRFFRKFFVFLGFRGFWALCQAHRIATLGSTFQKAQMLLKHQLIGLGAVHVHLLRLLSGPLSQFNAMVSPLQPLGRYRTPSAIGSAIGRPYLALSRIHTQAGILNRLVLSHLESSTARLWCYTIVTKTLRKQAQNKYAIEPAILDCALDRDWTLNCRWPLSEAQASNTSMTSPPFGSHNRSKRLSGTADLQQQK